MTSSQATPRRGRSPKPHRYGTTNRGAYMAKEKQVQVLANGEEVRTTEKGWDPKECADLHVLAAGWAAGSASHHSVGFGLMLAAKDKVEGAYLGDFEAEDEAGNTVRVPVIDPLAINEAMEQAFIEKFDLDVPKIARAAGNRTGARQELDSIKSEFQGMDADTIEAIRASNPALATRLGL